MAQTFNVTKAVDSAQYEAGRNKNKPQYCARFTTNAIEKGLPDGTTKAERPREGSAYQFGSVLKEYGFELIDTPATFQKGDVVIINRASKVMGPWRDPKKAVKSIPHGHMAIYDGNQWISDFKQGDNIYPGPLYRELRPSFQVYRHPGAYEDQNAKDGKQAGE